MIAIIGGVIGVMHTVDGVYKGDKDGEGVRMMEKDGENITKNARIAFVQLGVSFVLLCGKWQVLFVCVCVRGQIRQGCH